MSRKKKGPRKEPGDPLVTRDSAAIATEKPKQDPIMALENETGIYKHDSGGVRSYFRLNPDGTLELAGKRTLRKNGTPGHRKFRLRLLSISQIKIGQRERTYTLNAGHGQRKLKWIQRNSIRDKIRNPENETVQEVSEEIARRLETMPETFEEVFA